MVESMRASFIEIVNHNRNWLNFIQKKKSEMRLIEELGIETFETLRETGLLPIPKSTNWDRQHPLALHIEVIMHLLFLGIWKTLISLSMT